MMASDPHSNAAVIERMLLAMADARFGAERAADLESRLRRYAELLAYIAAEPVEFAGDPPDVSGVVDDE